MCDTCWLAIYQYFVIGEFIWRFFLQNSPTLMILPPDLVPTEALMTSIVPYIATCVIQTHVSYLLTRHILIFCHCRVYWRFFLKHATNLTFLPPDLVPKRGLLTGNWSNTYVSHFWVPTAPIHLIFTIIWVKQTSWPSYITRNTWNIRSDPRFGPKMGS